MTKIEYSDKIYGFLHKMKIGEVQEIDFLPDEIIPTPIAKAFFLDILRDFIKNDNGRHLGYYIELNSDGSRLRKQAYFQSKPQL